MEGITVAKKLDFVSTVKRAYEKKFPTENVYAVAVENNIGSKLLVDLLEKGRLPIAVSAVQKIAKVLGINYGKLYQLWLKESSPEKYEWVQNFNINSCMFMELVKYYRISNGLTRDEVDINLNVTRRGSSMLYERGKKMPRPAKIGELVMGMGYDESIIRNSLIRQKSVIKTEYYYGSIDSFNKDQGKAYIVPENYTLGQGIEERVNQLSISPLAFAEELGIDNPRIISYMRDKIKPTTYNFVNICALLNMDIYSTVDAYMRCFKCKYVSTNFGCIVFILSMCIGMTVDEISTRILHMSTTRMRAAATGGKYPSNNTLQDIYYGFGIEIDTLINMFTTPANYTYIKSIAYDVVRYVIENNWKTLNALNTNIVMQLFEEPLVCSMEG